MVTSIVAWILITSLVFVVVNALQAHARNKRMRDAKLKKIAQRLAEIEKQQSVEKGSNQGDGGE